MEVVLGLRSRFFPVSSSRRFRRAITFRVLSSIPASHRSPARPVLLVTHPMAISFPQGGKPIQPLQYRTGSARDLSVPVGRSNEMRIADFVLASTAIPSIIATIQVPLRLQPIRSMRQFWFQGPGFFRSYFGIPFTALAFAYFASAVATALTLTVVTSDNNLPARAVQWTDSAGQTRTAIMVDQRPEGAGYLRRLTYKVNGVDRVCTGTGDNGHQGDGYVQNHSAYFDGVNWQPGDD